MAATKLSQYQAVLRHLGDIRLATLTDDIAARYALDDAWDSSTAFVLRQAAWRHALKQTSLTAGGVVVNGYTTSYLFPADWLRTHAVYQYSAIGGRECPLDFRENGTVALSVNVAGPVAMRYVSSDYADPALAGHPWPEHFAQAHAAYLAFSVANRVTGDPGAAGRMSQLFSSLLPEAVAIDAIAEDPWLEHQRSGTFLRAARAMMDEGPWRFALKTVVMDNAGTGEGGLTYRFTIPSDWSRTRSLYILNPDEQRRPFDVRERAGGWHTNVTTFYAEYVSSTQAMDATLWPDHYMRAVLRQLEFGASAGDEKNHQTDGAIWKDALQGALDGEAEPPDPWLLYQFSGAFARCIPAVMSKGYWRFALKSRLFNVETDQDAVPTDGMYPYRLALPDDWFKTHAIFIPFDGAECPLDIREHEGHWSTATVSFMARYVSTAALDPLQWPDSVAKAVQAYLDFEAAPEAAKKNAAEVWVEALDAARVEWSLPEHAWLRFQIDGRYWETVKFVLGEARWRFAMKTVVMTADATQSSDGTVSGTPVPTALGDGSISPSYSAVFRKPPDWYRTIWMYRVAGGPQVNVGTVYREDIDFRDEGGAWHTNWDTIQVRYLSRDGLDSTRCPPSFRNAVLAWLQYEEARYDPKMTGVASAKLKLYEDLISRAKEEDDTREKPPTNARSRFVQARYGSRGYGSSGAGGGSAATTEVILTDDSGTVVLTP